MSLYYRNDNDLFDDIPRTVIDFYDRTLDVVVSAEVIEEGPGDQLTVVDRQGFYHVLTASEDLEYSKMCSHMTTCRSDQKITQGYRPK